MIEWRSEAALLATRPFGENSVIIEVFSETHGRHAGVVRGGTSRKLTPTLQPGAQLAVTWKARLEDHLGSFTVEPLRSRAGLVMGDRLALAGLTAVCALLATVLPEREPHQALYDNTSALLDLLGQSQIWPLAYLRWELALLETLGFGLELASCAVRGVNEELIYVSPRSGRAVSRQAAGTWADRLLPLPPVMAGKGDATPDQLALALRTTGYFIEHRLIKGLGARDLPMARGRLVDLIAQMSN